MQIRLLIACLVLSFSSLAQNSGFEFGRTTYKELDMITYQPDTTAGAVVLNEFGQAFFNSDYNLIFEYHVKIKILKRSGFPKADFAIRLIKSEGRIERILSMEASTFNQENNKIKEDKVSLQDVYWDRVNKNIDIAKFTLPDIRIGSVIELKYVIESPWVFNFHEWKFQDDIPKIKSEYWAKIPGNYVYNISLKGFLDLTRNESTIVNGCLTLGTHGIADCALNKYVIENIPAFKEEQYMTASSNFVSAIHFEIAQYRRPDGNLNTITKEWKDVDEELLQHENFGNQIRKARTIEDDNLRRLAGKEEG